MPSESLEQVGLVSEIPDGGRLSVVLNDEVSALLLRVADNYYCVEDVCTHDGQPMTDGAFTDCQLTCPRHGAKFDVRTGEPTCMPATEPIRTFPVVIQDDKILVDYSD